MTREEIYYIYFFSKSNFISIIFIFIYLKRLSNRSFQIILRFKKIRKNLPYAQHSFEAYKQQFFSLNKKVFVSILFIFFLIYPLSLSTIVAWFLKLRLHYSCSEYFLLQFYLLTPKVSFVRIPAGVVFIFQQSSPNFFACQSWGKNNCCQHFPPC